MFSLLIVNRKFINKSNKTHSIHMEPVQVITISKQYRLFYFLLFFGYFCLLRIFSMSNDPLCTASSN